MATETEKIILDVEFDQNVVQSAITGIQGYKNQIDLLKASQKELESQGQKNSTQYIKQDAEIKVLNGQVKQNQRIVEANSSAQKKQDGYVNQLKKSIKELTVQYDNLTKEEQQNINVGGKLADQVKKQSDELKKLKSRLGDNRLEVGAYKDKILEAVGDFEVFGISINRIVGEFSESNKKLLLGLVEGYQKAGLAAKLFGTAARTALTITGIGIFLAALALMITYWENIKVAIGLADTESEKYFKKQIADIEIARLLLEQYNKELEAQNQILQTMSETEDDIFRNRRTSLLLEINLAKQNQEAIKNRIESFIKENNLTAENLRLRKNVSEISGVEDPFIKKLSDLQKQFNGASLALVNFNNQLAVLDATQRKFNDDQEQLQKEAVKFANEFIKTLPEAVSKKRTEDQRKEIAAREKFQLQITDGLHKYADVQLGIEQAVADRKEQIWIKNAKDYNASNEAKAYADQVYLSSAKNVFGALSGLFDQATAEQKAFALTAIGIDTAQAISSAVKAAEANPFNATTFSAAGIAQFAASIVRILGNIAQAKSLIGFVMGGLVEPLKDIAGFAGGGLSGTKVMPNHGRPINRSNGDNRLATIKVGEVILNERQQARLGGSKTFRNIGVPGFAGGGGFSDGGFNSRRLNDQASSQFDINAMSRSIEQSMAKVKIFTRLTDIERALNQKTKTKVTSELR